MSENTRLINIDGMTCQSCVKNIENNVGKMNGISSIKVSLEQKQATVIFDTSQTNVAAIVEKINDMGFDAEEEKPSSEAPETLTLYIEGMTCTSCAQKIEASCQNLAGIKQISVSYPTKMATILYIPTNPPDIPFILELIKQIGFRATLSRLTPKITTAKIKISG
ncbi:unnamed protein product, partial [Didymodactylos carnosus]